MGSVTVPRLGHEPRLTNEKHHCSAARRTAICAESLSQPHVYSTRWRRFGETAPGGRQDPHDREVPMPIHEDPSEVTHPLQLIHPGGG